MTEIEESVEKKSTKETQKAKKAPGNDLKKLRLVLTEPTDSPLNNFLETLKDRGAKQFDVNEIVSEALNTVPQSYWDEKIDALTPVEYKLQEAMEDPSIREQILSIIGNKKESGVEGATSE